MKTVWYAGYRIRQFEINYKKLKNEIPAEISAFILKDSILFAGDDQILT